VPCLVNDKDVDIVAMQY